jgi:hypothetical protein
VSRILGSALALALGSSVATAENIAPTDDKAWAENVGWINAEPSGNGGPGVQVDDFELTGWMWGENVGWISLSCKNTASCETVAYGVRHDGAGFLSGYAWAENVGWISLTCHNTGSCATAPYGVTIDPATGEFHGEAWGENIGWIRFESTGPNPFSVITEWRCDPPPALPGDSPVLALEKLGPETVLSWGTVALATGYDVVFGELSTLRDDPGHFAAATSGCLADNVTTTSLSDAATPPVHDGFWFLVRGVNCGGSGTFDTGEPSQVAGRDPDIAMSGNSCP